MSDDEPRTYEWTEEGIDHAPAESVATEKRRPRGEIWNRVMYNITNDIRYLYGDEEGAGMGLPDHDHREGAHGSSTLRHEAVATDVDHQHNDLKNVGKLNNEHHPLISADSGQNVTNELADTLDSIGDSGGQVVYIPDGEYVVDDQLTFGSNLKIVFADGARIFSEWSGPSDGNRRTGLFNFQDVSNVEIINPSINGQGNLHAGFEIRNCDNVKVVGGTIENLAGDGSFIGDGSSDVRFFGTHVENVGDNDNDSRGLHSTDCERTQFWFCTVNGTGHHGIALGTGSNGLIMGSTSINAGTTYGDSGGDAFYMARGENHKTVYCHAESPAGSGIKFSRGVSNSRAAGMTIVGQEADGFKMQGATNCAVSDSTIIVDGGGNGFNLSYHADVNEDVMGNVISGNRLIHTDPGNNSAMGIRCTSGENNAAYNNTIDGFDHGVRSIDSSTSMVSNGNTFVEVNNPHSGVEETDRYLIDGWGFNDGDPNATGAWNGYGRRGLMIRDTVNMKNYVHVGAQWVEL